MGGMRPLPKTAVSAAVGAGAAIGGYYGVLFGESLLARRAIGMTEDRPPSADGIYGDDLPGRPIRCIMLGDSALVGYGMDRADATPPALIGMGLAHVLDTPVDVHSMAVVGAKTADELGDDGTVNDLDELDDLDALEAAEEGDELEDPDVEDLDDAEPVDEFDEIVRNS